jgi:hypothetical protein
VNRSTETESRLLGRGVENEERLLGESGVSLWAGMEGQMEVVAAQHLDLLNANGSFQNC